MLDSGRRLGQRRTSGRRRAGSRLSDGKNDVHRHRSATASATATTSTNIFVAWWQGETAADDQSGRHRRVGRFCRHRRIGGGLTNVPISNYTRDQGWGMGKHVGAIPSIVGGTEYLAFARRHGVCHQPAIDAIVSPLVSARDARSVGGLDAGLLFGHGAAQHAERAVSASRHRSQRLGHGRDDGRAASATMSAQAWGELWRPRRCGT